MPIGALLMGGAMAAKRMRKRGRKPGRSRSAISYRSGSTGVARRRRRVRLTEREKEELLWVKNNIGKTAAANLLPTYMRRGG